jgi:hypothetical protein
MNDIGQRHEALYVQIPSFKCKEGCTDCCGPVPFSKYERSKIKDKRIPKAIDCPYANGKCEIYENRPLICRLFGTVKSLQCPHGCRPIALLSSIQEQEITKEYFSMINQSGGVHT